MKVLTEYLTFHTKMHREYVHITPQVEALVKKSGVREGMALVSAMHITAGVYVNDNESGGWRNWRRSAKITSTIRRARTTATRTSRRSWCTTRSSCPSPQGNSISVPGNECFTRNSTAKDRNA